MWVQSLGWEDPLEKELATHSSILAWKIPWTEEPGGLQSMGLQESDMTERLYNNKVHIQIIFLFFVCGCPIVPAPFVLKLSFLH